MNKAIAVFTKESFLVPVIAIILGLLVGAIAMLAGGFNPILAYTALVEKVFGSAYNFGETIRQITPLIFTGLAVAFAFRTGLFNIGAEGQFIIGMVAATTVGVTLDLPAFIHAPLAILAGAVAGGLWGSVAGYLKAKRGVNEVITSIMMNWIALYLANWVMNSFFVPKGQQRSEMVSDSAIITITWLSQMFDNARLHWGTLIAVVAAIFFYVIMWKTKTGYELRAVGLNPHASEYAGMNVNRNVVKAMFISGLFAGIGGASEILGVFHYQAILTSQPGYGFDGIAVALIGGNTPIGVILGAILFGILSFGAAGIKFTAGVPVELIRVVIASVIFFVAAHGIVKIFVKPILKKKEGGN
ncbi:MULTISPECIES: ABC transporter permease [Brevibacillus]|uniref:ABC transporter permease n=1 Tax=Brevibacillus invocatus TaxID=173959 RepID=A0A3M8CKJ3_9BACL|nr:MULTISPECIES: ABC transporter permease [Brevibacillus]MCM3078959.1 ABC transporter permease [Brevibacillus invocatus]MCM3428939.1 ABC transporter permease [Brevibacillus invocatus]MDH4617260.1 ABC transporter permease [Brevibacillus sp. AY1]RNB76276.1 ABC transporter permease [Brevibacillus invocatus]